MRIPTYIATLLHSAHVQLGWIAAAVVIGACGHGATDQLTACVDPPRGPFMDVFQDVTHQSGVDFHYQTPDFKAGGLAVADLDGDGLPEILATRRIGGLALFHNLGGMQFEQVQNSGLDPDIAINAIAAVDLDNDGDRDLVLAGENFALVMENLGDGTFRQAARFDDSGLTEHILAADLDGDGLLDLYFGNYDITDAHNSVNRLYMNRGGLQFSAPALVGDGATWTTTAFDFDGDGDQDLYVANDTLLADFGRPVADNPSTSSMQSDLLLRNDGPGPDGMPTFTNLATAAGLAKPRSSMGGVLGDFDDDGQLDLYVPDYGAKKLFLRDAPVSFIEGAAAFGVNAIERLNPECSPDSDDEDCLLLSWSAVRTDFDLDGYDELLVVNGETELGRPPPVVMFARGPELPYHEMSTAMGCLDARGLVVTDLDGDGDQDVVISQKEAPLMVFKNTTHPAAGTWIRVLLHGHTSNREGVGAVVTLHMASGRSQVQVVAPGGVINSSSPAEAFFGLGADHIAALEVRWPSGIQTELTNPPTGVLVIEEQP